MAKADKTQQKTEVLSIEQLSALELLLTGMSDAEVAQNVGVSRQTVWLWRSREPEFMAELSERRDSLWSTQSDKLRALLPDALKVIQASLSSPDESTRLRAAFQVLKAAGMVSLSQPVSQSAQQIQTEQILANWSAFPNLS